MTARRFASVLALLASVLLVVAGCSSSGCGDVGSGDYSGGLPVDHTSDLAGSLHAAGFDDPRGNCTGCHGTDLKGLYAVSCFACHSDADHTSSHGGVKHRPGGSSTCKGCHGPSNNGGLGPACSRCH